MLKKRKSVETAAKRNRARAARLPAASKPTARWVTDQARRLLILENDRCRIALWPERGAAVVSYVDRRSGLDVIWRRAGGCTADGRVLDQPMRDGSDLFDVMDGSWYVSLPNGFFAGDYFGAPLGTHGELRSVPWTVTAIVSGAHDVQVALEGRSVRTPLVYRRRLVLARGSGLLRWTETLENRWTEALPVAWLHHPTFGGPLLDGARLIVPARTVCVYPSETPAALQVQAGYRGPWPDVPERGTGRMRDCSLVPAPGTGLDHSVQLTDLEAGWGCLWNAERRLGFALEWDRQVFPHAWSWNNSGGAGQYPLWGDGRLVTLQPSTSPVGRFATLRDAEALLRIPARGQLTTSLVTGFVTTPEGTWSDAAP